MGIYNCASTIEEAIESIIAQTYPNWELIICDDFSSDNTSELVAEYVAKYPDQIILLKNDENKGLNYTLNKCLKYARGTYIARMDGDDLCVASRFEEEVAILDTHPEFAIVSSDMTFFDENGEWGSTDVLAYPQPIDFSSGTRFCHAACMVRKEAYEAVGGYSEAPYLMRVEDFHLWVKMYGKGFRGINIKKPLYKMRNDRNANLRRKLKYRFNEAYVRIFAVHHLHLPLPHYTHCIKPIAIGLLPDKLYNYFYKLRHKNNRGCK